MLPVDLAARFVVPEASATAPVVMPPADCVERQWIVLGETLWDLACRRLLGATPLGEYREAVGLVLRRLPARAGRLDRD